MRENLKLLKNKAPKLVWIKFMFFNDLLDKKSKSFLKILKVKISLSLTNWVDLSKTEELNKVFLGETIILCL